jgi:hypothetical protein
MVVSTARDTVISNITNYNPNGSKVLFEKETFFPYPDTIGKQHNVYKTLPELVQALDSFIHNNHTFVCQKDPSLVNAFKIGLGKIVKKLVLTEQQLALQLFRSVKTLSPISVETGTKANSPVFLNKAALEKAGFTPFYCDALIAHFKNKPFTLDLLETTLSNDTTKRTLALDALMLEFEKPQISSLLKTEREWIDGEEAQELTSAFGKMRISHDKYVELAEILRSDALDEASEDDFSDDETMDNGEYYLSMIAPQFDGFIARALCDLQIDGKTLLDQINENDEFDILDHDEEIMQAGIAMTQVATINEMILNQLVEKHGAEKVYASVPPLHPFKLINLSEINMT